MIDFLNQLYPDTSGYLTLWTRQDEKTYWFPISNLPAIAAKAIELSNLSRDVYFGVGLAQDKKSSTRRTSNDTVTSIPGLWFDFDIQSPTKKNVPATNQDVINFLRGEEFLPSILVDSGHGLHGYWLFREAWDISEDRLRAADILSRFQNHILTRAATHKWKFDKTADLCRILRLPGTQNYKFDPVPVKVIHSSAVRYNPDDFDSSLPDSTDADLTKICGKIFESRPTDGPASIVFSQCIFMQHCRDNAADLPEPLWYAALTNLSRCKDGLEACHDLSRNYSRYSIRETDRKYVHARSNPAPQSCEYIRSIGFAGCPPEGCQVKNPVTFALSRKKGKKPDPETGTEPGFEKLTDIGNAERFTRMFDGQVKYCTQYGKWLVWDGTRWKIDDSGAIMAFAKKCVRSMYGDAAGIDNPDVRDALLSHAKKSESLPRVNAMLILAQHMMPVSIIELDSDIWLLNVKNGTLDLKTGKLMAPDPKNNATKLAPVTYKPEAKCPTFENFLSSTFDDNQNIIKFVQRFLGYCLTGETREQQFIIAFGYGRNGKGTLLELILDMLGDYAQTTPTATIMKKKNEGISNDVARLRGARYVVASEGGKGCQFDEALIKQMTGQDRMAARFLYQETFEFLPQFKLVLMTNDKPTARPEDFALWERIQLLPFVKTFVGNSQDKGLKTKLRAETEKSGILNWLIEGCLEWNKFGLQPPDEVVQATKAYQKENDYIELWMSDKCTINPLASGNVGELYTNFRSWIEIYDENVRIKRKDFTDSLEKKGFLKKISTGNYTKFHGIGLRAENRTDSNDSKGEVVFMDKGNLPY
jgi:putative DNA primase/helicase